MSSLTSTPVRLKASDVIFRSRQVSSGDGKSRCQGWFFAPWNGTSKPISTISYSGPSTASDIATTHGCVTRSTNPVIASGWTSTYQRRGPRPTAPPGRWIASQNAVSMSSRIVSAQSRAKAPFRPTIPSRWSASTSVAIAVAVGAAVSIVTVSPPCLLGQCHIDRRPVVFHEDGRLGFRSRDRRIPGERHARFDYRPVAWPCNRLARLVADRPALVMKRPLVRDSGFGVGRPRRLEHVAEGRARPADANHLVVDGANLNHPGRDLARRRLE